MKLYNGEKAIISLTSWRKRISTCGYTIFSLLKCCPGFHIVLVLSSDEFPNLEKDLPNDINLLCEANQIEIIWIKENLRSFKKIAFTMDKYKSVPIICADDGNIYKINFAEKLYNIWLKNQNCIISTTHILYAGIHFGCGGYGILYPPNCFNNYTLLFTPEIINTNHDDAYYGVLAKFLKIKYIFLNSLNYYPASVFNNIDESVGLSRNKKYSNSAIYKFKKLFGI